MSRIAPCDRHAAMWTGVDVAADMRWGYVAGSATINGITEAIVCHDCQWASDPTPGQIEEYPELAPVAEQALGSVGNPTERPTLRQIREHNKQRNGKKEKKMAKAAEPKKRERRRGMTLNRAIENMQVTLRVEGNVLDIPKEQRDAFWQLVDLMKALDEPPHA